MFQPYHIANTLTARMHKGLNSTLDEGQTPVIQPIGVFQDSEFGVQQYDSAGTLRAGRIPEHQMVMQPIPLNSMNALRDADADPSTGCGIGEAGEAMFTITKGHSHAVAQPIATHDVAGTMLSRNTSGGFSNSIDHAAAGYMAMHSMQVRRLTPVECERLQGFPDNYTAIPWRKKSADQCPDGPRYKALGNSMAVPVMAWIGKRIQEFEAGNAS